MSDGHANSASVLPRISWRERLGRMVPTMKYVRLFHGMEPKEWMCLLVGVTAAIAAGVPLPLIGLLFGKMVNGFNEQA